MIYTLDIPEYVSVMKRKIDMHYEINADSKEEAAETLSKHIFNKTKAEIKELIK